MDLITASNSKTTRCFNLHRSLHRPGSPVFGLRPLPQSSKVLNFDHHNSNQLEPNKSLLTSTKLFTHFLINSNRRLRTLATNAALAESTEPEPETEQESFNRILLSDVIVKGPRHVFKGKKWSSMDMATAGVVFGMHVFLHLFISIGELFRRQCHFIL